MENNNLQLKKRETINFELQSSEFRITIMQKFTREKMRNIIR